MEQSSDEQNPAPSTQQPKIDLEALAELVVEIMRRELLLEADRLGK